MTIASEVSLVGLIQESQQLFTINTLLAITNSIYTLTQLAIHLDETHQITTTPVSSEYYEPNEHYNDNHDMSGHGNNNDGITSHTNGHTVSSGSILDTINEKATNIELNANKQYIRQVLSDTIRDIGRKERAIRLETITFKHDSEQVNFDYLQRQFEEKWVEQQNKPPITYRSSKEYTFCKLASVREKNDFIDWITTDEQMEPAKKALIKPYDSIGTYFKRRPSRLEINNVKQTIKLNKVSKLLHSIMDGQGKIEGLKEGKLDNKTKSRSITFKADSEAVWRLIVDMDGTIPYYDLDNKVKAILPIRINCRPWVCKECHHIGTHAICKGKTCAKCGSNEHTVRDCKSRTRKCINCNKLGHRARDKQCPTYLFGVSKEIRKSDLPLEMLEEPVHIDNLIRVLQLK